MNIPVARTLVALLLLGAPIALPAADLIQDVVDRTLIRELMDRYGIVHDSGTPEEYADLFTARCKTCSPFLAI
jgi:hypothetical protein